MLKFHRSQVANWALHWLGEHLKQPACQQLRGPVTTVLDFDFGRVTRADSTREYNWLFQAYSCDSLTAGSLKVIRGSS